MMIITKKRHINRFLKVNNNFIYDDKFALTLVKTLSLSFTQFTVTSYDESIERKGTHVPSLISVCVLKYSKQVDPICLSANIGRSSDTRCWKCRT